MIRVAGASIASRTGGVETRFMIIDFSSNPPLPEFQKHAPHLQNYRRVYQASEQQVGDSVGPAALSDYLGAFVSMYGIREKPNNQPEQFFEGTVLDEVVAMLLLNPDGLVEFSL